MNTKTACIRLASVLSLFAVTSIASANMVSNGSFEAFSGTFASDGGAQVNPGVTTITGWNVVGPGNVALSKNVNVYNTFTPFGANLIDLTGYGDSVRAHLTQQISGFTVGTTYRLSFWLGLNAGSCGQAGNNLCGGPNGAIVSISGGAQPLQQTFFTDVSVPVPGRQTFDLRSLSGQLIANRIWDPFTYDFTAGAPTLTLDFQARLAVPGTNVFSALDNVSIVEQSTVIPLPAAGWLLLSGVGLLATLQRRRGQNAAHG